MGGQGAAWGLQGIVGDLSALSGVPGQHGGIRGIVAGAGFTHLSQPELGPVSVAALPQADPSSRLPQPWAWESSSLSGHIFRPRANVLTQRTFITIHLLLL